MSDIQSVKVTFFSKNPIECPLCSTKFYKEDLLSGRGRLIAGELSDELRRFYDPSQKYGELLPLTYPVIVCPSCYYAAYAADFQEVSNDTLRELKEDTDQRIESISLIFKELDFTTFRELREGAASFFLAIRCYDYFDSGFYPTFKRGLSSLRAAWLFDELHGKYSGENYDYLRDLFYRKAHFFYLLALERSQDGLEVLEGGLNYGPDLDNNYGYDGFLYITGLLEYKYGPRSDPEKRTGALENGKRIVSRLFGTGKASKSKPSAILEKAKDLYELMSKELKEQQVGG
jgi:uncharacterized protein (DUF2225 family)